MRAASDTHSLIYGKYRVKNSQPIVSAIKELLGRYRADNGSIVHVHLIPDLKGTPDLEREWERHADLQLDPHPDLKPIGDEPVVRTHHWSGYCGKSRVLRTPVGRG